MISTDSANKIRNKSKAKKGLRVICYISEAALSVATSVYQWTVPAATIFSVPMKCVVDLSKKSTLEEEYIDAIDRALDATKRSFKHSNSKLQILDELSDYADEMDQRLSEVIEHTESYRTTYSTRIDIKEIVTEFESNFKREIAEHSILSNYYIYGSSCETLDLLKKATIIVESDSKIIDSVYHSVNDIKESSQRLIKSLESFKTVMASGALMFSFFIIASTFFSFKYNFSTLIITYVALTLSEGLVDFLPFKEKDWPTKIKSAIFQVIIVSAIILIIKGRTSDNMTYEIAFVFIGTLTAVAIKMWLLHVKEK